jgi:hypothetical protein
MLLVAPSVDEDKHVLLQVSWRVLRQRVCMRVCCFRRLRYDGVGCIHVHLLAAQQAAGSDMCHHNKKKEKGRTKLFTNMVWYFPDLLFLGKEGRGISFFFGPGIPQTLTKEIKIRRERKKTKLKISYKQDFSIFFFLSLILHF